jgi:hypothetical protein
VRRELHARDHHARKTTHITGSVHEPVHTSPARTCGLVQRLVEHLTRARDAGQARHCLARGSVLQRRVGLARTLPGGVPYGNCMRRCWPAQSKRVARSARLSRSGRRSRVASQVARPATGWAGLVCTWAGSEPAGRWGLWKFNPSGLPGHSSIAGPPGWVSISKMLGESDDGPGALSASVSVSAWRCFSSMCWMVYIMCAPRALRSQPRARGYVCDRLTT